MTLLVIIDPIGNVPTFLGITRGKSVSARKRLAGQAVLVASGVLGVFALFGQEIIGYLGITLPALQVSGGLLLLLVALQLLTGKDHEVSLTEGVSVALVPLATPLIAGPGAIAATLVFAGKVHSVAGGGLFALAMLLVLAILYVVLRYSVYLVKVLREGGIALLTRVFALLLAAIAVELAAQGVKGFGF